MSESSPEQLPIEDDIDTLMREAAQTVEQLDRLYPIEQLGQVANHMILNPHLYASEEVQAVLNAFQRTHEERSIARPAIATLVEAEEIIYDADQRLHDLYPEIDRLVEE